MVMVITGKRLELAIRRLFSFYRARNLQRVLWRETTTTLLYLEVTIMKKTVIAIMGIAIAVIGI